MIEAGNMSEDVLASGTVKDQQAPDTLDEVSDTSSGPNGSTTKVQKTPTGTVNSSTSTLLQETADAASDSHDDYWSPVSEEDSQSLNDSPSESKSEGLCLLHSALESKSDRCVKEGFTSGTVKIQRTHTATDSEAAFASGSVQVQKNLPGTTSGYPGGTASEQTEDPQCILDAKVESKAERFVRDTSRFSLARGSVKLDSGRRNSKTQTDSGSQLQGLNQEQAGPSDSPKAQIPTGSHPHYNPLPEEGIYEQMYRHHFEDDGPRSVLEGGTVNVPIVPPLLGGGTVNVADGGRGLVQLNVYDLHSSVASINTVLDESFGTGAFHVGVEVYGVEYMYSGVTEETAADKAWKYLGYEVEKPEEEEAFPSSGVLWHLPRQHEVHVYKETIAMGKTPYSMREVDWIVQELELENTREDYNLIRNNCVHFADRMCVRLGVGNIPARLQGAASTISSTVDSVYDLPSSMYRRFSDLSGLSSVMWGEAPGEPNQAEVAGEQKTRYCGRRTTL